MMICVTRRLNLLCKKQQTKSMSRSMLGIEYIQRKTISKPLNQTDGVLFSVLRNRNGTELQKCRQISREVLCLQKAGFSVPHESEKIETDRNCRNRFMYKIQQHCRIERANEIKRNEICLMNVEMIHFEFVCLIYYWKKMRFCIESREFAC